MSRIMLILLAIVFFLLLPSLLVWRLSLVPIGGSTQLQLMWRGAVAGLAGGLIGATLGSLIFGIKGYAYIGYLYWLILTLILGMGFAFVIGAVQKFVLRLNLLARAVTGGIIGLATAWLWASVVRTDTGLPINWFGKGAMCMIVATGIVSGIMGGPLQKEG